MRIELDIDDKVCKEINFTKIVPLANYQSNQKLAQLSGRKRADKVYSKVIERIEEVLQVRF